MLTCDGAAADRPPAANGAKVASPVARSPTPPPTPIKQRHQLSWRIQERSRDKFNILLFCFWLKFLKKYLIRSKQRLKCGVNMIQTARANHDHDGREAADQDDEPTAAEVAPADDAPLHARFALPATATTAAAAAASER